MKKVKIKVTYLIPEGVDTAMDADIRKRMELVGSVWYAQGKNMESGVRDICFDLELSKLE